MNGMEQRFKKDDIVYFRRRVGNRVFVHYGIVDDVFTDGYWVDFLEPKETRLINGIPLNDFPAYSEWKKLPRGWTYNTELVSITSEDVDSMKKPINLKNPDEIYKAYCDGLLIKAKDKFHGTIETEVTKQGYRIVKKWEMSVTNLSLPHYKVYSSYEEAEAEVTAYYDELKRISELSDYDWSVEQIDRTIDYWAYINSVPQDTKERYREFLLSKPNVEDLVVRGYGDRLQWKYDRNKRWNTIEL